MEHTIYVLIGGVEAIMGICTKSKLSNTLSSLKGTSHTRIVLSVVDDLSSVFNDAFFVVNLRTQPQSEVILTGDRKNLHDELLLFVNIFCFDCI
jgi:hypothetical protein